MSIPTRIAIVTGANKGIGYHIALQLASIGTFSHVILGCRDEPRGIAALRELQQTLDTHHPTTCKVSYLPLTIGDTQSHQSFRQAIEESYPQVDVLVNNAGMAFKGSSKIPFKAQCGPTLDVNFRGTVEFTEEMLPLIRKGNDARIVNVASGAGRLSQLSNSLLENQFTSDSLTFPQLHTLINKFEQDVLDGEHYECGWGNSNYGMSKLALIAATNVWAREEAVHAVKVNCCCPGYCDTDMTSHKGPKSASEGAKNAVLLATMEDCPTGLFYQNLKVSKW